MSYSKILLIVLILLASGCSQPEKQIMSGSYQQPIKTPEVETTETDPCEGIACEENEYCRNGNCYCKNGFKQCQGECIEFEACCTDAGCSENELCIDHRCVEKCDTLKCEANKICRDNSCECEFGYTWCEYQEKCIKSNFCCAGSDCKGTTECTRSGKAVEFCFQNRNTYEVYCNVLPEQIFKEIQVDGTSYQVKALKLTEDDYHYFMIGNRIFRDLNLETRYVFDDNYRFYLTDFRTYGGSCEEVE